MVNEMAVNRNDRGIKKLGEFLRLTEAGYAADVARMPEHGAYIAKFAPMTQLLRAAS